MSARHELSLMTPCIGLLYTERNLDCYGVVVRIQDAFLSMAYTQRVWAKCSYVDLDIRFGCAASVSHTHVKIQALCMSALSIPPAYGAPDRAVLWTGS